MHHDPWSNHQRAYKERRYRRRRRHGVIDETLRHASPDHEALGHAPDVTRIPVFWDVMSSDQEG